MNKLVLILLLPLIACQSGESPDVRSEESTATEVVASTDKRFNYPPTAAVEQLDDYHGVQVEDPYRWLEEDVRESERVAAWVTSQNRITFDYLNNLPAREPIKRRLTELWNYAKYGVPFKQGGKYFYYLNDGLQNQSVLYSQDSLDGESRVVVDPNTWSDDGTVALADVEVSPNGKVAALAIQDGGSDWRTVEFLDLNTGERLADRIQWLKFSPIVWAKDGSGVYYSRYPEPQAGAEFQSLNHHQKVYFHALGSNQSSDEEIFAAPDHPSWGFQPRLTDDGRFLLITMWQGTDNRYQIAYKDLAQADSEVTMLIEGFDYDYTLVGNRDSVLYFRTNDQAPKGRLIAIDLSQPQRDNWRELVPESEAVLRQADFIGGHFAATYLKDASSQVVIFAEDGSRLRQVALPGIGSVGGFSGEFDDDETFYSYSSFNAPPTIYRYSVATGESTKIKSAEVAFNPDDYIVKQDFYRSKDGTQVPIFIAHRRDLELSADTPTLLYGYGGFNIPLTPSFSISRLAWMEMGGVFALANIRGGGEYGRSWHQAGTKLNKQNVFDDFIAAGEYLVAQGYTKPEKLAVQGGSNGGLLVGAVVNQRPDLFGAALPAVGVMDMLRFHQFTAGRFWVDDYGSADQPDQFKALYAYSPYHNIKAGTSYPAVLVTTADTDDRVVPGHSFKYAARLQQAQAGQAPVLIRIETRAGHGAGKPTAKRIEESADQWAFLIDNLDVELPPTYRS